MIDRTYDITETSPRILRYLVAVADHEHMGRAAQACRVSQPTLSAQLKEWEQKHGLHIFERSRKGTKINHHGLRIVQQAREALSTLNQFERLINESAQQKEEHLRCGVIPTIAPYLLPQILPEFTQNNSKIKIDIFESHTTSLLQALHNHKIDCAVLARLPSTKEFTSALCYNEAFLLACHPEHHINEKETITRQDILDGPLLLLQDGHCFRDQSLDLCKVKADDPQVSCVAHSLETLCQLVRGGFGHTLLPELALQSPISNELRCLPLPMRGAQRHIDLIWRPQDMRGDHFRRLAKKIRTSVIDRLNR